MSTFTVTLTEREERLLGDLAKKKDMSMEQLIKQACRFYQSIEVKVLAGEITPQQIKNLFGDSSLPKGCGGED